MKRVALLLVVACVAVAMAGCTDDSSGRATTPDAKQPTTVRVPGDHPTIQAAVDAARPGDMVLVDDGVYAEQVTIETDDLTLRGTDRNGTVLDGGGTLENGVMVLADGVAVENLTARNFRSNGVLFTGDYGSGRTLSGYRVAYVTAVANGLYGIYAFNARGGLIEQSYASGHPDSGFYIGQCNPCDALIRNVTSEYNAVGYQGTNAGGNLVITASVWAHNRVGLQPNSSVKERLAPQTDSVIVGNVIIDNSEARTPRATDAFGVGIAWIALTDVEAGVRVTRGVGLFDQTAPSVEGIDPVETVRDCGHVRHPVAAQHPAGPVVAGDEHAVRPVVPRREVLHCHSVGQHHHPVLQRSSAVEDGAVPVGAPKRQVVGLDGDLLGVHAVVDQDHVARSSGVDRSLDGGVITGHPDGGGLLRRWGRSALR